MMGLNGWAGGVFMLETMVLFIERHSTKMALNYIVAERFVLLAVSVIRFSCCRISSSLFEIYLALVLLVDGGCIYPSA
jgi:hypothetical protein